MTNIKKHKRAFFANFILPLIVFTCLGSGMTVHGEKAIPLGYEVSLKGEQIANVDDYYSGAVTVIFQLQDTSNAATLWINQENIWMLINRQKEAPPGQYQITITKDGQYNLSFKTENPITLEKITKEVSFSINSKMAAAIQSANALPDPQTANNNAVLNAKDEVRIAKNIINGLPSSERVLVPGAITDKLKGLCVWLENTKTGLDYTAPKAPSVELVSSGISTHNCYSSPVTAMVFPETGDNNQRVLMDQGDGWKQLEKNAEGKYTAVFTDPKRYEVRFCTADSSDNRSVTSLHKFSIDPGVPLILSEVQRIRSNLADLPLHDYITDLEKVYIQYLNLPPRRQALLPSETQEQLVTMYDYIMNHITFSYKDYDENGRYIQAIGLYRSLNVGMMWLQRAPVTIHAERENPPTTVQGVKGTALASYKISITPTELENVPIIMSGTSPVKICIQLPEDLKGKKNVEMFLIEGSTALPMGAKVRSTKDNLVLYFDITKPGDYVLVSQTSEK